MMMDLNGLNRVMEFDHVIRVHPDGSITEPTDVYPPDLIDDELSSHRAWVLMDGYSGQCGYSGPMMHSSEYIGGRLADDILSTPGLYVALVNFTSDEEISEWAVATIVEGQ